MFFEPSRFAVGILCEILESRLRLSYSPGPGLNSRDYLELYRSKFLADFLKVEYLLIGCVAESVTW